MKIIKNKSKKLFTTIFFTGLLYLSSAITASESRSLLYKPQPRPYYFTEQAMECLELPIGLTLVAVMGVFHWHVTVPTLTVFCKSAVTEAGSTAKIIVLGTVNDIAQATTTYIIFRTKLVIKKMLITPFIKFFLQNIPQHNKVI